MWPPLYSGHSEESRHSTKITPEMRPPQYSGHFKGGRIRGSSLYSAIADSINLKWRGVALVFSSYVMAGMSFFLENN